MPTWEGEVERRVCPSASLSQSPQRKEARADSQFGRGTTGRTFGGGGLRAALAVEVEANRLGAETAAALGPATGASRRRLLLGAVALARQARHVLKSDMTLEDVLLYCAGFRRKADDDEKKRQLAACLFWSAVCSKGGGGGPGRVLFQPSRKVELKWRLRSQHPNGSSAAAEDVKRPRTSKPLRAERPIRSLAFAAPLALAGGPVSRGCLGNSSWQPLLPLAQRRRAGRTPAYRAVGVILVFKQTRSLQRIQHDDQPGRTRRKPGAALRRAR